MVFSSRRLSQQQQPPVCTKAKSERKSKIMQKAKCVKFRGFFRPRSAYISQMYRLTDVNLLKLNTFNDDVNLFQVGNRVFEGFRITQSDKVCPLADSVWVAGVLSDTEWSEQVWIF